MIKKFPMKITGYSKKFKSIKLKPQKSPSVFSVSQKQATVESAQRKVFGELPEFMGMSTKATGELAAESLALRTANKKFFKTLPKELSRSRVRTARGIKGRQLKIKTPTAPTFKQQKAGILKGSGLPKSKPSLKKAKQKGAMKAYQIATKKSDTVFERTIQKFTGREKISPFKTRSKAAPKKFVSKEQKKTWGF